MKSNERLRIVELEHDDDEPSLSAEQLATVHGGVCGTGGTYDSKEGVCCEDTVCY
jgi:hypothetical protein